MAVRDIVYTRVFKPTRCYLLVTEMTEDGPSEVDRYVISDDMTFGDVCFKFDERGICKFSLIENYKFAKREDIENFTVVDYLHGRGLLVKDTVGGKHKLLFNDECKKYKLGIRMVPQNKATNEKPEENYTMSLLFVMSNTFQHFNELEKKKLEMVLPVSKIKRGAFPRGQMIRTFMTDLYHMLTGPRMLKLSVCLPDVKVFCQEKIKFILYIRDETSVRIKGIRIELVEEVYFKDHTGEIYVPVKKEVFTNYKIITLLKGIHKYELTFSVPDTFNLKEDKKYFHQNEDQYVIQEYSFVMKIKLPWPHENIKYKIPLQAECDPMK